MPVKKITSPSKEVKQAQKPLPKKVVRQRSQQVEREPLVKIGALWLKDGKQGKFMSGRIEIGNDEVIKVLVFKNNYKEEDRHPDYVIFDAPDSNPDRNQTANEAVDDDIPF